MGRSRAKQGEAGRSRARRGEARRAKALGSNSLKCPVVRKKPLRVKNSLPWCVVPRWYAFPRCRVCVSTPAVVRSIAFRSLFFLLGIILVFMASIKCTVDSSTFRGSTLPVRARPYAQCCASLSPVSEFDVSPRLASVSLPCRSGPIRIGIERGGGVTVTETVGELVFPAIL